MKSVSAARTCGLFCGRRRRSVASDTRGPGLEASPRRFISCQTLHCCRPKFFSATQSRSAISGITRLPHSSEIIHRRYSFCHSSSCSRCNLRSLARPPGLRRSLRMISMNRCFLECFSSGLSTSHSPRQQPYTASSCVDSKHSTSAIHHSRNHRTPARNHASIVQHTCHVISLHDNCCSSACCSFTHASSIENFNTLQHTSTKLQHTCQWHRIGTF